ncbi:hypothetical protein QR680_010045 [Steinernema hermaphroditum]|uniref:Uncharacterized protein n=1 Tax=Steinernema hermaphroditum TaxID=289476 RepID=A0AA39IPZ2_9BILA|nr:hypothetical protein QR680_010045 [Steinernema hermaphroditum]
MATTQTAIGILYMFIGIVFPPIYLRFIYIFISCKKYRNLECYRIMTLTGILQLFAGPGAFCVGLLQLLGSDPYSILLFFVILFSASIASEVFLNFILALNRLKVIFEIQTEPYLNKLLMGLNCIYGAAYTGCLLSPYCGYLMLPGHYVGSYDFSKPYTALFATINCFLLLGASILTFFCYVLIVLNLLWIRNRSPILLRKEGAIFIYAGVRFVIDAGLSIVFFFVHLPPSPWSELAVGLTYIFNQLLVSPLLYITLTKNLRDEFMAIFRLRRGNYISSTLHTSSHLTRSGK